MKINQSVFGNFWKIRQGFFLKLNKPHENEKWLEIFEIREDLNWLQILKKMFEWPATMSSEGPIVNVTRMTYFLICSWRKMDNFTLGLWKLSITKYLSVRFFSSMYLYAWIRFFSSMYPLVSFCRVRLSKFKMVWVITHQIRFIRFEKNYNSKNIRK